jgi:hypothetical protein
MGIGSRRLFDLRSLEGECFWTEGERDWRFDCSGMIEAIDLERGRIFGRGCLRGLALMGETEGGVRLVRDAGRMEPDDCGLGWIGEGSEICRGVGSSKSPLSEFSGIDFSFCESSPMRLRMD